MDTATVTYPLLPSPSKLECARTRLLEGGQTLARNKQCREETAFPRRSKLVTGPIIANAAAATTGVAAANERQNQKTVALNSAAATVAAAMLKGQCHEIFCFWFFS
jgi:hypothetical protein